jgi:hypothetical protein
MNDTKEKGLGLSKGFMLAVYLTTATILISTCFALTKATKQEIKPTPIKNELSKEKLDQIWKAPRNTEISIH